MVLRPQIIGYSGDNRMGRSGFVRSGASHIVTFLKCHQKSYCWTDSPTESRGLPEMSLSQSPISKIRHTRQPWHGGETVRVCTTWEKLSGKNTDEQRELYGKVLYECAKSGGNHEIAQTIVKSCVSAEFLDLLIDDLEPFMMKGTPLVCVVPHPSQFPRAGFQCATDKKCASTSVCRTLGARG